MDIFNFKKNIKELLFSLDNNQGLNIAIILQIGYKKEKYFNKILI